MRQPSTSRAGGWEISLRSVRADPCPTLPEMGEHHVGKIKKEGNDEDIFPGVFADVDRVRVDGFGGSTGHADDASG